MWILLLTSTFLPASLSSPQWDHLSRNGSAGSPRRVSKFLNLFSVVRWHFSIVVSDPYECNNFTSLKYFHVICLPCILSLSSKTNSPDFGTLVPSFQMYHFLSRFPNSGCSTHSGLNGTCYSETECRKRDGLVAGGSFLPRTVTFFCFNPNQSLIRFGGSRNWIPKMFDLNVVERPLIWVDFLVDLG